MIFTVVSPQPVTTPGSPGGFPERWSDARMTHIVVEITEPDGEFGYGSIVARYGADVAEENVYRRGALVDRFIKESFIEEITGGIRIHILREGGWPRPPAGVAVVSIDHDAGGTSDGLTSFDWGFIFDAIDDAEDWGLVAEALDQPDDDYEGL